MGNIFAERPRRLSDFVPREMAERMGDSDCVVLRVEDTPEGGKLVELRLAGGEEMTVITVEGRPVLRRKG